MAQYYDINKLLDDIPSLLLQNKAQKEQSRQFDASHALRSADQDLRTSAEARMQDAYNVGMKEKMSLSDLIKTDMSDVSRRASYFKNMEDPEMRKKAKAKIHKDADFGEKFKLFFKKEADREAYYNEQIESQAPERLYPDFSGDQIFNPTFADYFNRNTADQYATRSDKMNLLGMMGRRQ
jgi:hypothetical protein